VAAETLRAHRHLANTTSAFRAYFPLHEKEGDRERCYQPHPFSQEVKRARQRSISEAEVSVAATQPRGMSSKCAPNAGLSGRPAPAAHKTDMSVLAAKRAGLPAVTMRTRTAPVVEAYNPTGIRGSAAPLGKYYPSNYNKAFDTHGSTSPSLGPASPVPSFPLSEARQEHQLRQYKLDIISQTAQIAREALGRRLQNTANLKTVEAAVDERTRLSVALLRRYKPSSPRITPLLSPGPVTPMTLDGNGESDYLSVKQARPR
jgi:hypothetical protein